MFFLLKISGIQCLFFSEKYLFPPPSLFIPLFTPQRRCLLRTWASELKVCPLKSRWTPFPCGWGRNANPTSGGWVHWTLQNKPDKKFTWIHSFTTFISICLFKRQSHYSPLNTRKDGALFINSIYLKWLKIKHEHSRSWEDQMKIEREENRREEEERSKDERRKERGEEKRGGEETWFSCTVIGLKPFVCVSIIMLLWRSVHDSVREMDLGFFSTKISRMFFRILPGRVGRINPELTWGRGRSVD